MLVHLHLLFGAAAIAVQSIPSETVLTVERERQSATTLSFPRRC